MSSSHEKIVAMAEHDRSTVETAIFPLIPPPVSRSNGEHFPITNCLQYILDKVMPDLQGHKYSGPFLKPVDVVKYKLADYTAIISKPMDLGSIRMRLLNKYYKDSQECIQDINLVFRNCYVYNANGGDVVVMAKTLEKIFKQKMSKMPKTEYFINENANRLHNTRGHGRKKVKFNDYIYSPIDEVSVSEVVPTIGTQSEHNAATTQYAVPGSSKRPNSVENYNASTQAYESSQKVKKSSTQKKMSVKRSHTARNGKNLNASRSYRMKRRKHEFKPSSDSEDESDAEPMTYDEMRSLALAINELSLVQINEIARFIQDHEQIPRDKSSGELIVDLDELKPSTLHALKQKVQQKKTQLKQKLYREQRKLRKANMTEHPDPDSPSDDGTDSGSVCSSSDGSTSDSSER